VDAPLLGQGAGKKGKWSFPLSVLLEAESDRNIIRAAPPLLFFNAFPRQHNTNTIHATNVLSKDKNVLLFDRFVLPGGAILPTFL